MPTADEYASWIVQNADKKGTPEFDIVSRAYQDAMANRQVSQSSPVKIGKEAFGDTLRQVLQESDWGTRNIAGAGTALSDLWQGAKQLVGAGDKQAIEANNIIKEEAPIGFL